MTFLNIPKHSLATFNYKKKLYILFQNRKTLSIPTFNMFDLVGTIVQIICEHNQLDAKKNTKMVNDELEKLFANVSISSTSEKGKKPTPAKKATTSTTSTTPAKKAPAKGKPSILVEDDEDAEAGDALYEDIENTVKESLAKKAPAKGKKVEEAKASTQKKTTPAAKGKKEEVKPAAKKATPAKGKKEDEKVVKGKGKKKEPEPEDENQEEEFDKEAFLKKAVAQLKKNSKGKDTPMYYNVATKRCTQQTSAAKKKYTFYDAKDLRKSNKKLDETLNLCGPNDDEQLNDVLRALGVLGAKQSEKVVQGEDDEDEENEEESEEEQEEGSEEEQEDEDEE
jgi:hypothetical protein